MKSLISTTSHKEAVQIIRNFVTQINVENNVPFIFQKLSVLHQRAENPRDESAVLAENAGRVRSFWANGHVQSS